MTQLKAGQATATRRQSAPPHPQQRSPLRSHPFLDLIPYPDRRQAIVLFRVGVAMADTPDPDAVLDAVLVCWACLTLDGAAPIRERLSARRTCFTLLRYKSAARQFAAELLAQATPPIFDDSEYTAMMEAYGADQAAGRASR